MKRLLCVLSLSMTGFVNAEWTPPQKPNPDKILEEAKTDADAERYEDALAKHVWYHQNALKYKPVLAGVRLSYALGDWVKLGAAYPPALEKVKSIRDEAGANIRAGKASFESFQDYTAINKCLNEGEKTKDLFIWLDTNNPTAAREVYDLAQPALIKAKEYRVCGRYVNPESSFHSIRNTYRTTQRAARDLKSDRLQDSAGKMFSSQAATLVALLALTERKVDADRIAVEAAKEWDDPMFKQQLEKARNGELPRPWP